MEPAEHELKPLKPSAKMHLSYFRMFLSGSCHSKEKCDQHKVSISEDRTGDAAVTVEP
jgi:hypothetical protein